MQTVRMLDAVDVLQTEFTAGFSTVGGVKGKRLERHLRDHVAWPVGLADEVVVAEHHE